MFTGFKISLFGVMNDTTRQQFNYLIPKSVTVGKSSSYIVNMLDHYFANHALGETSLSLHADNCCWQNKNFTLMCYLNYRILRKLNIDIELNFMQPGHTRFSVDWAFGLFKQKFRRSTAYSVQQVANIVENSTPQSKVNQSVMVSDERGQQLSFPFKKWMSYFETLGWKRIPHVTSYYHFTLTNKKPGIISCRKRLDDIPVDVEIGLIIPPDVILEEDISVGLPKARQQYLFANLREYCPEEYRDLLCPPVAVEQVSNEEDVDDPDPEQGGPSTAEPSTLPRKRGRPRKDTPSTSQSGTISEPAPARPRGRPRKDTPSTPQGGKISEPAPARPRGRRLKENNT
jgi:hypothetical protein